MSTFEHDAVIATLAERASAQIRAGLASLHAGEPLQGEVFLNAASATLASLQAHLDGTPPPKPMRKLALVGTPRENYSDIPEWFTRKANSEDPNAA